MELTRKFHKMEIENSLFELGNEINLPLWDIIRYNVYIKYYYSKIDSQNLEKELRHFRKDYFELIKNIFLFFFRLPFQKGKNIVFPSSRYINNKKQHYDKVCLSIISSLKGNCMILEPVLGKNLAYDFLYNWSIVLRRFSKKQILSNKDYDKIEAALIDSLGECRISFDEINTLLKDFYSDYRFYYYLFRIKSTKKIFLGTGNPKAQIMAANLLNIKTYLLQHASIEFDEIDYSYPKNITRNNRILFSDSVLTIGEYWCKGINVPAKEIINIGNDFFYRKPNLKTDNSILVVSTIIHGSELKFLTKRLATSYPNLILNYKLHPNEFHLKNEYQIFFSSNTNVQVITSEYDTNELISKSILVILIVSAVFYEALNQNKKVAIYKKINYLRQAHLFDLNNVYLIEKEEEVISILNKESFNNDFNFYEPTNFNLINKLIYS